MQPSPESLRGFEKLKVNYCDQEIPMWPAVAVLLIVWLILKFAMGKGGFVHILLVTALSVAIVQIIADRKTRYQRKSSGQEP